MSEAQLTEASVIFGTEYLELGRRRRGGKYRERGVGVDLGMDSDDLLEKEEDDESNEDLFGDDEDPTVAGLSARQRQEALRLKREKRRIEWEKRRRDAQRKISNRVSMISWRHMMAFGRK